MLLYHNLAKFTSMSIRLQGGWNIRTLQGCWGMLLNVLNFADFALHAWYSWLFAGLLLAAAGSTWLPPQLLLAGKPFFPSLIRLLHICQ